MRPRSSRAGPGGPRVTRSALCLTARLGLKKASAWLQKKHTGKVEERLELSFRTEAKTRLPVVRFAARKILACVFRVTGGFLHKRSSPLLPLSVALAAARVLAAIAASMSFSFSTLRRTVRPSVCTPPWGERSQARGGAPCMGKGKGESASTVTNLGLRYSWGVGCSS